jgi:exoribonuclease II
MQVLFEDEGELKAGTVRSATDASLQVDSTTGRRLKVRNANVLLRFEQPAADTVLTEARLEAGRMDVDFLWQCAPQDEFGFEQLAAEYCGRAPTPVEAAAILMSLQAAPVYFQRKGRGRFRPATPEVLRAALAGLERRRQQEAERERIVRALEAGELPEEIARLGASLLLRPDRNSVAFKAVEQAAHALQTSPLRLLLARGAIASPYAWHCGAFLARCFPEGVDFPPALPAPSWDASSLPLADVPVFSIDDSATTEIDDGFSVRATPQGVTIGVHIAAPALAIAPDGALDAVARARLSTVYAPGLKYTMLPAAWVDAFSLQAGVTVPALSLYFDLAADGASVRSARSVLERIAVVRNLRYDLIEQTIDAAALDAGAAQLEFGSELASLWRFANALRAQREMARGRPELPGRDEYAIVLDGDGEQARVGVRVRRRDAPLDRIVAELMIAANSHWGRWLEEQGAAAVYRSQSQGRVRMATTPAPHEGLGASHYAWCTSPLRRYVDLVNQRQLLAVLTGVAPPHRRGDAELFAAISAFEAQTASYAQFQESMERYWSLRWIEQEGVQRLTVRVGRGDVVHFVGLPLAGRIAGADAWPRGQLLEVEILGVDLVEIAFQARIARALDADAGGAAGEESSGAEETA